MAETTSTTPVKIPTSTGSLVSHILLWVCMVAIGGWLLWSATHTTTKNESFAGQSKQINTKTTYQRTVYCLLDLLPFSWEGCVHQPKDTQDEPIANSQSDD